jgi:hypothetical protein
MNINDMIMAATRNAPPPPSDNEKSFIPDLFLGQNSSNVVSWNDPNFFAGKGKNIYEWNLKDMLNYCEEQYALTYGKKPAFAVRPAMMAMSSLRHSIESNFGKKDVNPIMRAYIEWSVKNIKKYWKGKVDSWYPQKMVADDRIKNFISHNAFAKEAKENNSSEEFVKRPINPILLEEFYRGDPCEFVSAYGIVVVAAFLIKMKEFSHEDAVNFVVDSCVRLISSGKSTESKIMRIDDHYRPFDRFAEIDPEGLLISVKNKLK